MYECVCDWGTCVIDVYECVIGVCLCVIVVGTCVIDVRMCDWCCYQALKFECYHTSALARMLLEKSVVSVRIGHHLYW